MTSGKRLTRVLGRWITTSTAAGKSPGSSDTICRSGSIAPAEPPITTETAADHARTSDAIIVSGDRTASDARPCCSSGFKRADSGCKDYAASASDDHLLHSTPRLPSLRSPIFASTACYAKGRRVPIPRQMHSTAAEPERALLVGVERTQGRDGLSEERSLDELELLAETAARK